MPSRTTTRATTGCYCGCGCRCRTAAPSPLATRPAPCAVASAKAAFRYSRHSRAGQPGPPAPPASARKQLVLKSPARLFAIEGLSDDHFRCVSSVALRSREGPFTEPRAGAQPRPRERVLMPHSGHSRSRRLEVSAAIRLTTSHWGQYRAIRHHLETRPDTVLKQMLGRFDKASLRSAQQHLLHPGPRVGR